MAARYHLLLLLGFAAITCKAFNKDDNEHGYTGYCPHGWREIDQFCYKVEEEEEDFRDALEECTDKRDTRHMVEHHYWDDQRYPGLTYNLMPVPMLRSLMEHGQRSRARLGRGPYRVNAIKTSYDHKWREYDGGNHDLDVYKWRGGREVDFSQFPDFDEDWGEPGDTLVWYPHSNRLYARPHYHKYKPLCYRRKKDAERCPGIPECNYHGDCYHGKCYCYKGYVGDDCQTKAKLLILGGQGSDVNYESDWYAELFDFETMTSCIHSELPYENYAGEIELIKGTPTYCGGALYPFNVTLCYEWSCALDEWVPVAYNHTTQWHPRMYFDSLIVTEATKDYCEVQYWWLMGGVEGTAWLTVSTDAVYFNSTTEIDSGPDLPYWNQDHCAVKINEFEIAMVGGSGTGDDDSGNTLTAIYDTVRDTWFPGPDLPEAFEHHECEVVLDPYCGHPTVVLIGSADTAVTSVYFWDTVSNEFRVGQPLPTTSQNLEYPETVKIDEDTIAVIGGYDGTDYHSSIWTYTMKDGFLKVGDMMEGRYLAAAVMVSGEEYACPVEPIVPTPGTPL